MNLDPQTYSVRRAKLVSDYNRLLKLRLNRSAAARVRQIAQLDFEYDGTDPNKTKAIFNYDQLMR